MRPEATSVCGRRHPASYLLARPSQQAHIQPHCRISNTLRINLSRQSQRLPQMSGLHVRLMCQMRHGMLDTQALAIYLRCLRANERRGVVRRKDVDRGVKLRVKLRELRVKLRVTCKHEACRTLALSLMRRLRDFKLAAEWRVLKLAARAWRVWRSGYTRSVWHAVMHCRGRCRSWLLLRAFPACLPFMPCLPCRNASNAAPVN